MVMTSLIGLGLGAALSAGMSAAQGGSAGDILKSAAIGGGTGLLTAGVGSAVGSSAVGLLGSGLSKVGTAMGGQVANAATQAGANAAVQTGANAATSTVVEAGKSTLMQKVGTSLLNVGAKMSNFGAAHGVGATISKVSAKIAGPAPTGPTTTGVEGATTTVNGQNVAQISNQATTGPAHSMGGNLAQNAAVNANKMAPVPNGGKAVTQGTTTATTAGANVPNLRPYAKVGAWDKFKQTGAGKVIGQVGVQGALSLLTTGASIKAANDQATASNKIATQSLLFQKQSYNEQQAEKNAFKASMKQSAAESYESSQIFGSKLQGSDANNTLLTSYSSSGNGAVGDYSILTYSSSRLRDKT